MDTDNPPVTMAAIQAMLTSTLENTLSSYIPDNFKQEWEEHIVNYVALEEKVSLLQEKVTKMEKSSGSSPQARQYNLVIMGIPEEQGERPKDVHPKVSELLHAIKLPNLDYDDAYRQGRYQGKPRAIILRLLRTRDKHAVFAAKKNLRTDPNGPFARVSIFEDSTPEQNQTRKLLVDKIKELKNHDATIAGSIRGPSLFIRKDGQVIAKYMVNKGRVEARSQ